MIRFKQIIQIQAYAAGKIKGQIRLDKAQQAASIQNCVEAAIHFVCYNRSVNVHTYLFLPSAKIASLQLF